MLVCILLLFFYNLTFTACQNNIWLVRFFSQNKASHVLFSVAIAQHEIFKVLPLAVNTTKYDSQKMALLSERIANLRSQRAWLKLPHENRKKHLLRNERGKRFVFARKICGKQQQQHFLWLPGHPSPYIRVELSVCPRYFLFCGKSALRGCDRPYPREIRLSLGAKGCFPLLKPFWAGEVGRVTLPLAFSAAAAIVRVGWNLARCDLKVLSYALPHICKCKEKSASVVSKTFCELAKNISYTFLETPLMGDSRTSGGDHSIERKASKKFPPSPLSRIKITLEDQEILPFPRPFSSTPNTWFPEKRRKLAFSSCQNWAERYESPPILCQIVVL